MRIPPLFIALKACGLLVATCHSEWQQDYAELSAGVPALEMSGTPGSVGVLGQNAFPIARAVNRQAVVGAGYFGDSATGGRVLALAHTGFASAKALLGLGF